MMICECEDSSTRQNCVKSINNATLKYFKRMYAGQIKKNIFNCFEHPDLIIIKQKKC